MDEEKKPKYKIYNFDEAVAEYYSIVLKGHTYRFKYMTLDEMDEWINLKDMVKDEKRAKEILFSKIDSPEDPDAPPIAEIWKQLTIPEAKYFFETLILEHGNS